MVTASLQLAPALAWPMAIAIPASLTRVALALGRISPRAGC
jgi:hypothetical protein